MGDANVRCPVATRFEHGVDFGLLVHKSPFMADNRDPLVLSNYIFELLEVNPGVAGFLIQLHTQDVDAVVESVTAHAEKGAGTKTTLRPYKRRLKNCFKGWSLVRPSVSLRHMHHCMSMKALEQGLLGLEAAKA